MKYIGLIIVITFTVLTTLILTGMQLPYYIQVALSVVGGLVGVAIIIMDRSIPDDGSTRNSE